MTASRDPLFGPEVAGLLAEIDPGAPALAIRRRLEGPLGGELARRATALLDLRRKARGRFPRAHEMFFTARGLEQATHPEVATQRAEAWSEVAPKGARVLDATAGIGSDALALVGAGFDVVAADRDLEVLRCARANLALAGSVGRVVAASACDGAVRASFVNVDPDRRAGGRRSLDPNEWSPSLDKVIELARSCRAVCAKLAPALDPDRLAVDELPHRLQWVSRNGELAEVRLWLGESGGSAGAGVGSREVVAMKGGVVAERFSSPVEEVRPLETEAAKRVEWISEPDPALVRSGLLGALAKREGLAPLGPRLGFLGGSRRVESALLRSRRVLASAPVDPRRVRPILAEFDVGPVDVKKRGHPDSPAVLERKLRGKGSKRGMLFVARLGRGHWVYLVG